MRAQRQTAGVTDALWRSYRSDGDGEARTRLLDNYLGLVHHSARDLLKRVSLEIELEDLLSAGTVGLVQALEGFDPGRGLAFSTYAVPRIRGAMLDELRSRDWLSRATRQRHRQIAQARATLEQQLGRPPGDAELAERLGIGLEDYWRWRAESERHVLLHLDQPVGVGGDQARLGETIADPDAAEPSDDITREQQAGAVRDAMDSLPQKERLVLTLYYYEELNLREIGEVLHLTESRVSQIRTQALRRLRERIAP